MKSAQNAELMLVEEVLEALRENFGDSAFVNLKSRSHVADRRIPTSIAALNDQLDGGFKTGTILELYGREGVGKTTFALNLAAEVQQAGMLAAFVDVERTFDRKYAVRCGIDESSLWLSEPDSAEEALTICEKLLSSRLFGVIVLDSVAALSPKREKDIDSLSEVDSPLQSRILTQAVRRISHSIGETPTLMVFINQLRYRPKTCHFEGETTPGGATLKFSADYRLKLCDEENDFVLAKGRKL